jgi:hypothetical protein
MLRAAARSGRNRARFAGEQAFRREMTGKTAPHPLLALDLQPSAVTL